MKFKIRRTSGDTPPCLQSNVTEDDFGSYSIELNTLEELMALVEKYGDVVVSTLNGNEIEIYDDYRE